MTTPPLLIEHARVLPCEDASGHALDDASVLIENGCISAITAHTNEMGAIPENSERFDARGRVLMPAFVDCHTHACWAGERLDEWEAKLNGATYLELLSKGGGIMSTVRAVRAATENDLAASLFSRLEWMLAEGTTTVEVKSGYGLTINDELKMLRAIRGAGERWAGTVVPTACIGHAIDPAQTDHIERTIRETLPAVHAEFPGVAIDAYCETGAWSLADCVKLFEHAHNLGHPIRVHADQFNDLGMIPEAIRLGAVSVDHLEASTPEHLAQLAASDTMGVVLPCSGFHVDQRYANARTLLDSGGRVAIATNWNPGSAPCGSMPLAIGLACRHNGFRPLEAVHSSTARGAEVLGLLDRGRLVPGLRADLVLLRHTDERMLAYEVGGRHADLTIVGGAVVPGTP